MLDDKTQEQLMYEEAVTEVRDSVRKMKEDGADFKSAKARKAFRDNMINTMTKVANDKRIFE